MALGPLFDPKQPSSAKILRLYTRVLELRTPSNYIILVTVHSHGFPAIQSDMSARINIGVIGFFAKIALIFSLYVVADAESSAAAEVLKSVNLPPGVQIDRNSSTQAAQHTDGNRVITSFETYATDEINLILELLRHFQTEIREMQLQSAHNITVVLNKRKHWFM